MGILFFAVGAANRSAGAMYEAGLCRAWYGRFMVTEGPAENEKNTVIL